MLIRLQSLKPLCEFLWIQELYLNLLFRLVNFIFIQKLVIVSKFNFKISLCAIQEIPQISNLKFYLIFYSRVVQRSLLCSNWQKFIKYFAVISLSQFWGPLWWGAHAQNEPWRIFQTCRSANRRSPQPGRPDSPFYAQNHFWS